jgi:hypothetical protein
VLQINEDGAVPRFDSVEEARDVARDFKETFAGCLTDRTAVAIVSTRATLTAESLLKAHHFLIRDRFLGSRSIA